MNGRLISANDTFAVATYVWDPNVLEFVAATQASGGGGTSSNVTIQNASIPVTQAGTWNINSITSLPAITGTVSISNFPATQAISASSLPLPTGAATEATLSALNTKIPAVGQALMAASQPVVIASNQSAIPVTGTFWQATQPVSGSVSVSNFPATQAVTGTFWQATQPVSLASLPALATGTNTIGNVNVNGTVPVSGTFWQATQPVSGPLTDTQLRASAVPVSVASVPSHPVTNAGTFAVQVTSTPASTLAVTATAAANTAVTLTIPAAGAGLFHYITYIEITRTATAALTGSATLSVTTTNLPGSLAWSFGNAMAAGGTSQDLRLALDFPLKSSVANTATTIVMPAPGAAVLWRATVFYYTGT